MYCCAVLGTATIASCAHQQILISSGMCASREATHNTMSALLFHLSYAAGVAVTPVWTSSIANAVLLL